jgi:hypothetical protein
MSKIEKQSISTKLTKYQIIDTRVKATKENLGGKNLVMDHGAQTNFIR